jgi:hypothetical protein
MSLKLPLMWSTRVSTRFCPIVAEPLLPLFSVAEIQSPTSQSDHRKTALEPQANHNRQSCIGQIHTHIIHTSSRSLPKRPPQNERPGDTQIRRPKGASNDRMVMMILVKNSAPVLKCVPHHSAHRLL